jgi:hypothetical protein
MSHQTMSRSTSQPTYSELSNANSIRLVFFLGILGHHFAAAGITDGAITDGYPFMLSVVCGITAATIAKTA